MRPRHNTDDQFTQIHSNHTMTTKPSLFHDGRGPLIQTQPKDCMKHGRDSAASDLVTTQGDIIGAGASLLVLPPTLYKPHKSNFLKSDCL